MLDHDNDDDGGGGGREKRRSVLSMTHACVCGALHVLQASEQADGWVLENMLGLRLAWPGTGCLGMDTLRNIFRDNRRLRS